MTTLDVFIMNPAIIILTTLALFFLIASVFRFVFFDHKTTITIKVWLRISAIFFVVSAILLIF